MPLRKAQPYSLVALIVIALLTRYPTVPKYWLLIAAVVPFCVHLLSALNRRQVLQLLPIIAVIAILATPYAFLNQLGTPALLKLGVALLISTAALVTTNLLRILISRNIPQATRENNNWQVAQKK